MLSSSSIYASINGNGLVKMMADLHDEKCHFPLINGQRENLNIKLYASINGNGLVKRRHLFIMENAIFP